MVEINVNCTRAICTIRRLLTRFDTISTKEKDDTSVFFDDY